MGQLSLGLRVPGGKRPRPEESRRPLRRCYAYGAERERAACEKLRRLGFTPMRSAGSHGPADVLGVDPTGRVLAVQVKAAVEPPTPGERAEALSMMRKAYPAARREVWWWSPDRRMWVRFREEGENDGPPTPESSLAGAQGAS